MATDGESAVATDGGVCCEGSSVATDGGGLLWLRMGGLFWLQMGSLLWLWMGGSGKLLACMNSPSLGTWPPTSRGCRED